MDYNAQLDSLFDSPNALREALVSAKGGANAYNSYLPFGFDESGNVKHGVRYEVMLRREMAYGLIDSEWTVAGFIVHTWGDVLDVIFG